MNLKLMRSYFLVCTALSSALLCGCATPPAINSNPQNLNNGPDLSAFRTVELSSNASGKHETVSARFVPGGAYLDLQLPAATQQRLYVQPQECRNDSDPFCSRRFVLTGELAAFGSQLKCFVEIRNDANSIYLDQALQGLCHDQYRRAYSITISK